MPKRGFTALAAVLLVALAGAAAAQSFQPGVSRAGDPFATVTAEGARRCQKACIGDGHCKAWVFIGTQPVNNCRLLPQRTAPQEDPCCYSGVVDE